MATLYYSIDMMNGKDRAMIWLLCDLGSTTTSLYLICTVQDIYNKYI